ncbi:MAG: hypothetical protein AB7G06_05300 [Bdellovibrionales bacterium]
MKLITKFIFALALPLLAACASSNVTSETASVDYGKMAPIRLNASKIEVVSEYVPRGSAPSVDHMMDRNPQLALVDWAKGRLRAAGNSGYAQVKVKDASVTSRVLEQEGGISGYFTREQAEELVARLEVDITAENADQNFSGYTTIQVSQVLTVPEHATKDERKAIERDLVNKLMDEFNNKAETGIRQHLNTVLIQ